MRMDKRVREYLAWLDNQFENALDAADSDAPSEYQEGLTDGFDRAEAAFRDIFDVKMEAGCLRNGMADACSRAAALPKRGSTC